MAVCALLRIVSYRPALCSALAFDDDPSLWCFCLPVTHESRIQSPELVHSWTPQHVYPGFHNCSRRSSSSSSYLGAIKSWQASSSDFLWPPLFLEFSNGLVCWYYTSRLSASLPGSLDKKTRSNIHIDDGSCRLLLHLPSPPRPLKNPNEKDSGRNQIESPGRKEKTNHSSCCCPLYHQLYLALAGVSICWSLSSAIISETLLSVGPKINWPH
jgi:hypothetical protein